MKRLLPLYCVITFGYFGYSTMVPIFSAILIDQSYPLFPANLDHGQRTFLLGLLLMTYPLGQFFGSPIMGSLSDKYGRKPLILTTLCFVILTLLCTSLCMEYLLNKLMFLVIFLTGFFESNISIAQSAIADISTPDQKTHRLGFTLGFASTGFTLGPIFGGYLAQTYSYSTPFWVLSIILLLFVIWIYLFFEETHPEDNRVHVNLLQAVTNLRHVIVDPNLRPVYAISFVGSIIFFGFLRLFPGYLFKFFHLNLTEVSYLIAISNIPMFLTLFFLIKPLVKRFGPKRVGYTVFCTLSILLLFFMYVKALTSVMVVTLLLTLVLPFGGALYAILISARAGVLQGRALGNNTSVLVGGQTVAILVLNALAGIDYLISYTLIAILCLVNAYQFFRLKNPNTNPQK